MTRILNAVAAIFASTLVATPAVAAITTIYVSGQSGTPVNSTTGGVQEYSGVLGTSSYYARAQAGILKASSQSVGPASPGACCVYAGASLGVTTSVTDTITVNAPGFSSGAFMASLLIDGDLTANASGPPGSGTVGFASMQIKVEVAGLANPVLDFSYTRSNYNGFIGGGGSLNGMRYSGPLVGSFDFVIPFENLIGQDVTISLFCGSNAINLQAADASDATCAYAHTVKWGGVSQVFDATNAPISGATILGKTGVSYANSFAATVPEPSSWALLMSGFGLVGAVARRERRCAV